MNRRQRHKLAHQSQPTTTQGGNTPMSNIQQNGRKAKTIGIQKALANYLIDHPNEVHTVDKIYNNVSFANPEMRLTLAQVRNTLTRTVRLGQIPGLERNGFLYRYAPPGTNGTHSEASPDKAGTSPAPPAKATKVSAPPLPFKTMSDEILDLAGQLEEWAKAEPDEFETWRTQLADWLTSRGFGG